MHQRPDRDGASPLTPLAAARRHPLIVLASLSVLLAAAAWLGLRREAVHSATVNLLVSQREVSLQENETTGVVASYYASALRSPDVLRRIGRATGVSPARVRGRVMATSRPPVGLEITATGPTPAAAMRLADGSARALVRAMEQRVASDPRAAALQSRHRDAVARLRAAVVRRRATDGGSRHEVAAARALVEAAHAASSPYADRGRRPPVAIAASAVHTGSDRMPVLVRFLVLAVGSGLLVGLVLAVVRAEWTPRWTARRGRRWVATGIVSGVVTAAACYGAVRAGLGFTLFVGGAAAVAALAAALLLWRTPPWVALAGGLVLTPFSGHWRDMGLPGGHVAPDRFLLAAGVIGVLLRNPWMRARPPIRPGFIQYVLLSAAAYAIVSAFAAGTLFDLDSGLRLVEQFGLMPFLVFLVAPVAFAGERQRRGLLVLMVVLGAYLSLLAVFETTGLRSLVVPRYINDPSIGIHFGRARGPFAEAVSNGVGLFASGTAAVMALRMWRSRMARAFAAATAVGCLAGLVFTLQRSVWLGAVVALLVTGLTVRRFRPLLLPVALTAAGIVLLAVVTVPGLQERLAERAGQQETVWERENLNAAAFRMLEARPLTGFGWDRFVTESRDYFELADHPLTGFGLNVHNVYLDYASTLGLIGLSLYVLAIAWAILGAATRAATGPVEVWRTGFIAYASFYLVVSAFVPPQVFPNLMLWVWAGLLWRVATRTDLDAVHGRVAAPSPPAPPVLDRRPVLT